MTNSIPQKAVDVRVSAELQAMLERCVAAGISPDDAQKSLYYQVLRRNKEAGFSSKDAPLNRILWDAYDAQHEGQTAAHHRACEAWLQARHGIKLGDVVEIHGASWDSPREVLLDGFRILWLKYAGLNGGYMWFKGPCSRTIAWLPPIADGEQGCPIDTELRLVTASNRLTKLYPERFIPKFDFEALSKPNRKEEGSPRPLDKEKHA